MNQSLVVKEEKKEEREEVMKINLKYIRKILKYKRLIKKIIKYNHIFNKRIINGIKKEIILILNWELKRMEEEKEEEKKRKRREEREKNWEKDWIITIRWIKWKIK